VLAQARSKIRVVPRYPSCRDLGHDTTLTFVPCWHNPKFIVSCRTSGRAKMLCFVRPIWHDPSPSSTLPLPRLPLAEAPSTSAHNRPVRLAYQPPASTTFLQNKPATSNQSAILLSHNKSAPLHQPSATS
jgi:hypothetical protein